MTAALAYREAVARLTAAGLPDAARDARLLMAHALEISADRVMLALHDPMPEAAAMRLEEAVTARLARQPVSQITGQRQFWGRSFRVTRDVLDPRPETETLVAEALAAPFSRILDLGTGSGAILLTLLAERSGATGIATDLSDAALEVARGNAVALGLTDRASFLQGDWFAPISGRFDLIVSNPPYIAADEMAGLSPEVREWEPHLALTPGGDGLDAYRAIAAGARDHLLPQGRLLVEIGPTQGAAVAALFSAAGLAQARILTDLDNRHRVVSAIAPQ
ncbi:MAG: protein-(glutamine-N5) methyltransferase, release factor-specific [Rhodobacterales bacterium 65-51]|uniref:peptide chain release factor N(5)-glutamine methyltransferase n=1 Tax=uncultured Gemmobacter sp. TaxID=1095917 RepID=UPI000965D05D|nr:peptide chain release factor N(5)-glutamine methyltransferase [uncultured Gemmobacter sp.]OJY27185.1 MAG: protein-(glutamine-N5) methyltransferase, release factor-specific [Rhodobacterales bacterium 65-51]